MRTSKEVCDFAAEHGLKYQILNRGESYRAGGYILVWTEGLDIKKDKVALRIVPGAAFDGTGYMGRGREYDMIQFSPATEDNAWVRSTMGQYQQAAENDRVALSFCRFESIYYVKDAVAGKNDDLKVLFGMA